MRLAIIAALLLVLSGCGKSPRNLLIGDWDCEGSANATGGMLGFHADGQFRMNTRNERRAGSWRLDNAHTLRLAMEEEGLTESLTAEIDRVGRQSLVLFIKETKSPVTCKRSE